MRPISAISWSSVHEDVRVVLRERAHPHQAVQRAGGLVAVHLAEFGEAHRQVAVAAQPVLEDLHVARAVHRLDGVDAVLGLFVVYMFSPKVSQWPDSSQRLAVHDLGAAHLLEAGRVLLLAHVADQRLEERPALRVPEHRARRLFLEVEQVELLADPAVVALLRFLEPREVGLEAASRPARPCRRSAAASRCANRRASRRPRPSSA